MTFDQDVAAGQRSLGVIVQPGIGRAWPELKRSLIALYRQKVAELPWLPSAWMGDVARLDAAYPDDLVVLAASNGMAGDKVKDAPAWQDAQQREVWTTIALSVRATIQKYAAGQAAAGAAELARLRANAGFWNRAYLIAVEVRDAVPNAVGFVGTSLWSGLGGKWKLILIVGGAGVIAWKLGWLQKGAGVALAKLKA